MVESIKKQSMTKTKKEIDILLESGYLLEEDAKKILKKAEILHVSPLQILVTDGILSRVLMGQAIAEYYKIPYANLSANSSEKEEDIFHIPERTATSLRVVFVSEKNETVHVATDTPVIENISQKISEFFPKKNIEVLYALPEEIDMALVQYRKPLKTRFSQIITKKIRIAPEILQEILEDALIYQASDIHLEPKEDGTLIRFRIDGILKEAGNIPKEHYGNLINHIKVQSRLRIDEHNTTQDGAMRYDFSGGNIDIRISIAPTIGGEKVTMRLLTNYVQSLQLAEIGLSRENQKFFEEASQKPFGMILVTGPTGAGKTTTLYSLLQIISNPGVNITTIEDPVEYHLPGLNQIQVNTERNITFSKGLRSIVRQDPDIILVGEIRDEETAEIAVNAALTGHLLLSTFHANDAATAIPRLLEMGVEPFLLASTLELIGAQRLIRKICPHCRYSIPLDAEEMKDIRKRFEDYLPKEAGVLYRAKGCVACHHTGYKGRTGIFECIPVSQELQDLILQHPSSKQIWALARKKGAITLFEDGMLKVRQGITTLEELLRVASPPEL